MLLSAVNTDSAPNCSGVKSRVSSGELSIKIAWPMNVPPDSRVSRRAKRPCNSFGLNTSRFHD